MKIFREHQVSLSFLNLSSLSSLIPGCSFVSLRLLVPSDERSLNRHGDLLFKSGNVQRKERTGKTWKFPGGLDCSLVSLT